MAISKEELQTILKSHFPEANIHITALIEDGEHYKLEIVDESFRGKTIIAQHKLVKEALKEILLSNKLHAITINTRIPS